jgi:hypothetical protein
MRFSAIATTLALAANALALPGGPWQNWAGYPGYQCLNATQVSKIISGYTYLLQSPGGPQFASIATSILDSSNFTVQSDSINTLSQRPVSPANAFCVVFASKNFQLGQPAFPSVQAFIGAGSNTPPLPVVTTLNVYHNCDQITWRWKASGAAGMVNLNKVPVTGIIIFDTNPTTHLVNTVFSEFNTAAFETDLGNPECQAPK